MGDDDLHAEQRARRTIDAQLTAAGWHVQDQGALNLSAGPGVAVREKVMAAGHGRADYLLYLDKRAVGVIEAKPAGISLAGVAWQSAKYATGLSPATRLRAVTLDDRLPFVFEASGSELYMTDGYDPDPRSRRLFGFPGPETLARTVRDGSTWRGRVRTLPPLDVDGLRPAQIEAINGLERSLAEQRFDRSLIQMATDAGKTYTAVISCYRLLKHGGFKRILFLVDRNNLATQSLGEFQNYAIPGDGRRFHRSAQRRPAHRGRDGRGVLGGHLDNPAGVRGAARGAGQHRRRPAARRSHPRRAGHCVVQPIPAA